MTLKKPSKTPIVLNDQSALHDNISLTGLTAPFSLQSTGVNVAFYKN